VERAEVSLLPRAQGSVQMQISDEIGLLNGGGLARNVPDTEDTKNTLGQRSPRL